MLRCAVLVVVSLAGFRKLRLASAFSTVSGGVFVELQPVSKSGNLFADRFASLLGSLQGCPDLFQNLPLKLAVPSADLQLQTRVKLPFEQCLQPCACGQENLVPDLRQSFRSRIS